ncbi:BrnA antitoxin family protein [uncultured Roseobacter sp.]|uniref:BrnA antitoxin family protein n=1 Tax=uncultured Roseobacter sp. TaxID=114847 RepID=UPI0026068E7C|nr:BrnA antitoxin family protein [uncultured Roseobacter sp.]
MLRGEVPAEWFRVKHDIDCHEPKVRVTLMLDESVAKMFRAMGRGYQARINRILQTWLQQQILGFYEVDAIGDTILEENIEAYIADMDEQKRLQRVRIWRGVG